MVFCANNKLGLSNLNRHQDLHFITECMSNCEELRVSFGGGQKISTNNN